MQLLERAKEMGRIRPDGAAKVTGALKYMTDVSFPDMLHGKILRSAHPHARILSICTERAKQLSGVKAVATYHDVPGLNGYGIVFPDQPVLCEDRVRCVGDAIAAVAAETEEVAERALDLIEVIYEPLPVIDSPEKALNQAAPQLHPNGNILHRASYEKGDIKKGFASCSVIIEETYELPRQMHAYMETEGGVVVPECDGTITVYAGTQHGYKDRFQLSRILDMPEASIRVVSSPMGGSFGGKDELNIQPYAALLALMAKRPVKIHQTRRESVRAGIKRHPMKITMKTGADENGQIVAHEVRILADTGAYATLGPAVLDFAVEHAIGPYVVPNVSTEGLSVYTNNGVAGEFRGFGGNQVTFALEGQIDRLAEKLQMDPLDLRRRNIRKEHDLGPVGQRIAPTNGAAQVLEEICKKAAGLQGKKPDVWKKTGTGISITMHGGGLGYGRLDPAGGRLSFGVDGKIEAAFGFEECGQGLLAVIETLIIEEFACSPGDIKITIGDTALVPSSGSSTASRATSMVWQALQRMKEPFRQQLLACAARIGSREADKLQLGPGGVWRRDEEMNAPVFYLSYAQLAKRMAPEERIVVNTQFDFPTSPDPFIGGHYLYAFSAVLAQVEVDELTGRVKVTCLDQAIAAGPVVSPLGYLGQIEGGGIMALGYTLMEEALIHDGCYVTNNFDSYLIPTIYDVPEQMEVEAIEELCQDDSYGPRGVGEIGTIAVAPAIAKAIHDATGYWVRRLPVSPEEMLQAISAKERKAWTRKK
ncbi:xanthine dehydrogenase subunit D [Ectobacillus funiculus]|uniref:xanthine dehydrogenase subunit D n=1 Tax=Ectobacillus funiculus TaxID=137993 RepID=UPI001FEB8E94|nr:xanthine dehydrogenase subunit D [Ectobacillus funiculus]